MDEFHFHTIHTDRPGIRKVLGDLEADIMEYIWSQQTDAGITVRDVFDHFLSATQDCLYHDYDHDEQVGKEKRCYM